jgi:ABC-type transport system involved in multi-copper enzyme maturation permease subunit
MRQFVTIARNAFMELVRQPVFLLLMTASAVFCLFLATPYYFAFGDEPKLVKNSTLAVMLLSGLFGAVISASASLAREIRSGTALAVLAKPVGRAQFIVAKFTGVAGALVLLAYVNLLACLLASRMAFDAYGSTDLFALGIFALALVLAYALGGLSNFFLRRPFVSDAVFAILAMATLAFVVINFFDQHGKPQDFAHGVDWNILPAAVLILFALWVLAGLAIACSTRFDMIPTLAICTALFFLGLISDYLFGRAADRGEWWGAVLYSVVPNWQLFWLADAVETGKSTFHWGYVGKAAVYMACYVGAALAAAVMWFEDRELS